MQITSTSNRRVAIAGALVVTTIGAAAYSSVAGGSATSETPPRKADSGHTPNPSIMRLANLRDRHGIAVNVEAAYRVPAPGATGERPGWLLAPTSDGGVCGDTGELVFCGRDRASVQAGRAAVTTYPPDENPRQLSDGRWAVTPSSGEGKRSGVAPSGTVDVRVVDAAGGILSTAVVQAGVYEIVVPRQGSQVEVQFHSADGRMIASRPAA